MPHHTNHSHQFASTTFQCFSQLVLSHNLPHNVNKLSWRWQKARCWHKELSCGFCMTTAALHVIQPVEQVRSVFLYSVWRHRLVPKFTAKLCYQQLALNTVSNTIQQYIAFILLSIIVMEFNKRNIQYCIVGRLPIDGMTHDRFRG